jgi:nucleoid-associated protein YgaU
LAMLLTDPNGSMSVQPYRRGPRRIVRPAHLRVSAIAFLTCATLGASASRAQNHQNQNVAGAARQERARKQQQQKQTRHVYTEEDLKRQHILTPEHRAQIEARRNECAQKNNCSPAAPQNPPAALDANSQKPGTSLGEVARQLRKQKELQALKPKQSEPFHLPFSTPALASPVLPEGPANRPAAPPVLHPEKNPQVSRRDPFAHIRVHPEVRQPAHPVLPIEKKPFARPVAPAFSARPTQPAILSDPAQPVAPVEGVRPVQQSRSLPSSPVATQKTVRIQPGDSLWKLAQQNLGSGNRWHELLAANPWIANPNQIRVGVQLILPDVAAATRSARSTIARSPLTIKVRKGDTLWNLSKSNLGRSSYWRCLAAANPSITDPTRIYEGQKILLPSGCTAASQTVLSPVRP